VLPAFNYKNWKEQQLTDIEQPLIPEPPATPAATVCRYCKKEIARFAPLSPMYCPYCGGMVGWDLMRGKPEKDTNPLTGRALWPLKWSLLSVLIGMALLMMASVIVPLIMIFAIMAQNPSLYTSDSSALENLVYDVLLNPFSTALLSVTEFVLVIPPFALMRKYRKGIKDRFMLLGWRPYTGESGRGWGRLGKDLALGLFIALGLVGFQFIVVVLNDAFWSPFVQGGNSGFSDIDAAITPQDPLQLVLLVASMMFVIGPTEEMLFRGFSQQGLEARLDPKNGLVISALLFTLAHVIGGIVDLATLPFLFFPYFYLSLVLCGIYWKTKDLNLMIFIHGMYDSLLVVYSYIFVELERIGMGAASDIFVYVSFVAFGVLGVYVIASFIIQQRQRVSVSPVLRQG
jgi:membrane protease YdiL (CAAX protease family)